MTHSSKNSPASKIVAEYVRVELRSSAYKETLKASLERSFLSSFAYKLYGLPPSSFGFAQDYGWARQKEKLI